MIYLEMYGRLGNQFFRYAAARALQEEFYPEEKLVINFQQVNDAGENDPSFYNVLTDYNVAPFEVYEKGGKVIFQESSIRQKALCIPYYMGLKKISPEDMNATVEYERQWQQRIQKAGIYWFRRGYWDFKESKEKKKFLSGNFEDPRFFQNIRHQLLQEFTPVHCIPEKNKYLYELMRKTNAVCLSVRRGDFESNPEVKKLQSLCDRKYFEAAIERIKQEIESPVFFMFSDDIKWVHENISTGCETYYEDGTDPVWEKLRLMSSCKHFIISNSTFSWWSQYLSESEKKIVISPERWFNNNYDSPLIDKEWIRIKV